jgi:hypothetical protein
MYKLIASFICIHVIKEMKYHVSLKSVESEGELYSCLWLSTPKSVIKQMMLQHTAVQLHAKMTTELRNHRFTLL